MVFPILYYKSEIVQPVTVLINQMITAGIFPDKLKIAKVVSLYQLGYNTQFYAYFESNKLLDSSQYGFRQGHSTALELKV